MALNIIKATDPVVVSNVKILIYGQPGIGKTSLAFTSANPLCLDFDKGSHRSKQRKDALDIDKWPDVVELMQSAEVALAEYDTIVVDTVGRSLDMITRQLIADNYKLGNKNGALAISGWGELKGVYANWTRQLTLLNKDYILIAHDKEDKDGDVRYMRPDIQGGSYAEVLKTVDFVGYLYSNNNKPMLDFNPTDKWIGKNAAGLKAIEVPDLNKHPQFFAELIARMKSELSTAGSESAEIEQQVRDWADTIEGFTTPEEFNTIAKELEAMKGTVKVQVGGLIRKRRTELGIEYDAKNKTFFVANGKAEEVA